MISGNSIKVGRLFGIDLGINLNWFIIFFIMVMSFSRLFASQTTLASFGATLAAISLTLLLFASIVAHEYGHALTARAFGIKTRKIVLHLFGGVAFLESEPRRPMHEFWIAIAGPAVSIVLGVLFGAAVALTGGPPSVVGPTAPHTQFLLMLCVLNLFLGVFNCVPGFPLDGGRVVRAAVWAATGDYLKATRVASFGGVVVGSLIMIWGFYGIFTGFSGGGSLVGGLLHVLLGAFVIYLARMSARQATVVAAFHGLTVRDIMRPIRAVVPADALLTDAFEGYLQPLNIDQLPVVQGSTLLGYISAQDVLRVPKRQWDWIRASELVRPYDALQGLDPSAEALTALERIAGGNRLSLPVFQGRKLLGFIMRNDLLHIMRKRRMALGGR